MNEHTPVMSEKQKAAEDSLPADLIPVFRKLFEEYRFVARVHFRSGYISYVLLAELIKGGWRPSAEAIDGLLKG